MSAPGEDLTSHFDVSQSLDKPIDLPAVHAALCLLQAFAASGRDVVAGWRVAASSSLPDCLLHGVTRHHIKVS
jgi:hypothetical protein